MYGDIPLANENNGSTMTVYALWEHIPSGALSTTSLSASSLAVASLSTSESDGGLPPTFALTASTSQGDEFSDYEGACVDFESGASGSSMASGDEIIHSVSDVGGDSESNDFGGSLTVQSEAETVASRLDLVEVSDEPPCGGFDSFAWHESMSYETGVGCSSSKCLDARLDNSESLAERTTDYEPDSGYDARLVVVSRRNDSDELRLLST